MSLSQDSETNMLILPKDSNTVITVLKTDCFFFFVTYAVNNSKSSSMVRCIWLKLQRSCLLWCIFHSKPGMFYTLDKPIFFGLFFFFLFSYLFPLKNINLGTIKKIAGYNEDYLSTELLIKLRTNVL